MTLWFLIILLTFITSCCLACISLNPGVSFYCNHGISVEKNSIFGNCVIVNKSNVKDI